MEHPMLFKRASGGKIQQWRIWTQGNEIHTEYGQQGGKLQTAVEVVKEGKNAGRSNATTPEQQAEFQAKAEWTKKVERAGYVESLEKAQAGVRDQGGVPPMLAKAFKDDGHKITYPCMAQPKLDGMRCIAVVGEGGQVSLWSRTATPITSVPHIVAAVERFGLPVGTVLDGELYNHKLKADFQRLISIVRKKEPAPPEVAGVMQYHVYDLISSDQSFGWRHDALVSLLRPLHGTTVELVSTHTIASEEALQDYFEACLAKGYEGAMARNSAGLYERGKRSAHLQKLKETDETDFRIVGVHEGVGKMAACAVFECETDDGQPFNCKLEGPLEALKPYLLDESTWQGKKLSVKHLGWTGAKKPRCCVGKVVRDYE